MSNQQTGREAFEALVEKWRDAARGIKPSGTWNGNDLADRYEWCADELEAALARGSASEVPAERQAVEVTEEMVDRAMTAYTASRGTYAGEVPTDRDDIRAALLAALSGKTEVE